MKYLLICAILFIFPAYGDAVSDLINNNEVVCVAKKEHRKYVFLKIDKDHKGFEKVRNLVDRAGPAGQMLKNEALIVIKSFNPMNVKVYHITNGSVSIAGKDNVRHRIEIKKLITDAL